jgi:hypothetical protein
MFLLQSTQNRWPHCQPQWARHSSRQGVCGLGCQGNTVRVGAWVLRLATRASSPPVARDSCPSLPVEGFKRVAALLRGHLVDLRVVGQAGN